MTVEPEELRRVAAYYLSGKPHETLHAAADEITKLRVWVEALMGALAAQQEVMQSALAIIRELGEQIPELKGGAKE